MDLKLTIAELEAMQAAITHMQKLAAARMADTFSDFERFDAHLNSVMYSHLASKVQSQLHIARPN